jgi:hypothetical protein
MLLQGNQGQVGKQVGQNLTVGLGETSDMLVTELNARYYEQNYRGNTYFLSVAAAAGTAFVGAAGGTPLLGIYNPAGSGKNLVLKAATIGLVAAASAAGQTQFRIYAGVSALPTGTLTVPINANTLQASGSVAKGIVNTAMTSSTAIQYVTTIGTYYWATAAGAVFSAPITWDAAGQIIVAPGNLLALGAVTIPTSMTNDASLFWDEVPV